MPEFGEKYIVEKEVGRGGAGRVFLAYDGNVGREVAIKEVELKRAPDQRRRDRALKRFLREAKLTAQLEHPNIIPIYDLKTGDEGSTYYVMKYVRGKTLKQAIDDCAVGSREDAFQKRMHLLGPLIDICEAMAYAHSKGIIHRDLKPGNIVIGEFGETILLDWGLAKRVEEQETSVEKETFHEIFDDGVSTRHDAIMGTPSYMAPEQADEKFGAVDEQSDVYSLGALLFFVLTGERVYEPGGKEALGGLMSDVPTPAPRRRNKCIPPELAAICEKATAKDKSQRFLNAQEMVLELCAYRDGRLVTTYAYSRGELLKRFIARNKLAVVALMALVLVVIAGAGFSLNFAIDADHARARAERALVDISAIAEEAMNIARRGVRGLEAYKKAHGGSFEGASLEITELFGFDPATSPFQVWAMAEDGEILYDEDEEQVGKVLFTDTMYVRFPELQKFGERMQEQPWGMGYYSFFDQEGQVTYKIAAWDTIHSKDMGEMKVVVTHPYDAGQ